MPVLDTTSKTLKFSISGLRGVYGTDLHPGNIPQLTLAFHETIGAGPVAIGWDARPANNNFANLVSSTLSSLNREVHILGLVPTPTIKHYVNKQRCAGAIMLSASHNPIEYVALKLIGKKGFFFDADLNKVFQKNLEKNTNVWGNGLKRAAVKEMPLQDTIKDHIESVKSVVPLKKGQKGRIAIDPVGSCAISIAEPFLKQFGYEVIAIHDQVTGKFPRQPEPVTTALQKLSTAVKKHKCLLGFAFDPDADRLAIVDEKGQPIGEEATFGLALDARLSFDTKKKRSAVINLSSSAANEEIAARHKASVHRSAVGEANVLAVMLEKKAILGGEGNGGVIDPKIPSLGRDSVAAMAYALYQVQKYKEPFSEIVKRIIPNTYMVKKSLPITNKAVGKDLEKRLLAMFPDLTKNTVDGVHLQHPSLLPWIHLRFSNTEPILRLILETRSKKEADEILKKLKIV